MFAPRTVARTMVTLNNKVDPNLYNTPIAGRTGAGMAGEASVRPRFPRKTKTTTRMRTRTGKRKMTVGVAPTGPINAYASLPTSTMHNPRHRLLVLAPMRPVPHRSLRLLVKPISRFGHPPPCRAR